MRASPEYTTIGAVTRQDLVDWHKKYVQPNNIILGISGDFDSAAMEAKLRAGFRLMGERSDRPEARYRIQKRQARLLSHSQRRRESERHPHGRPRHHRNNPDYYAIEVFNEAFGGGFSSRLFLDIRTKRGLAYSVGGGIGTNFDRPGITRLVMGTKSQTTDRGHPGPLRRHRQSPENSD